MQENRKQYVLGFMLSEQLNQVLLIEKNKPEYQKGKLNGIGGKIEEGELPSKAMIREFEEETTIKTKEEDWTNISFFYDKDFIVHMFYSIVPSINLPENIHTEEGMLTIEDPLFLPFNTMFNLRWMLPLILDKVDKFSGNIEIIN